MGFARRLGGAGFTRPTVVQTRLRITHGDVLRVSSAPHPKQSNPCTGITPVALTLPASQLERAVMAGWAKP